MTREGSGRLGSSSNDPRESRGMGRGGGVGSGLKSVCKALTSAKSLEATGNPLGHQEVSGLSSRVLGMGEQRRGGQRGPGHGTQRPR